ncbi:hypothetical protein CEXT_602461 [Caerostris extrusa]|uniref:Uncharacterized protein n=1 Tax=Caerostris extrusa TaxID=172846 RepID=A0AAV4WH17_CAEEX|nr:hypothetical protein CEXT_602461 [Caerostris extrusa]
MSAAIEIQKAAFSPELFVENPKCKHTLAASHGLFPPFFAGMSRPALFRISTRGPIDTPGDGRWWFLSDVSLVFRAIPQESPRRSRRHCICRENRKLLITGMI